MGAVGVKESIAADSAAAFRSPAEVRKVFETLLESIDGDPVIGPLIRSNGIPHRFVFPDMDIVINVTASEEGEHALRWCFSDCEWETQLTLEMDSDIANRYLQGKENLGIALARRRIRAHGDARAALTFLPSANVLIDRYRDVVARDFPHLALD